MARRTPKILVHWGGEPFAVWHEEQLAYAMYFSDDDYPTPAEDLNIIHGSVTDLSTLRWVPVRVTSVDVRNLITPYDPDTGEEA